ncbi:MAG: hypothetical protein WBG90_07485, partial [Saonia sp.]
YTTLWNTLGLMVETHMLKPYKRRVVGTYQVMTGIIDIAENDTKKIKALRKKAAANHINWKTYPLQWVVDTTKVSLLNFKGYEADTLKSEVTGFPRLAYDRSRPFTKKVPYKNHYVATHSVKIPKAYVIKKGWSKIIDLLELNGIEYSTLEKDTILSVESYTIENYKTAQNVYEGHYPHYDTQVSKVMDKVAFLEGDYMVQTDQPGIRYLLETMEPEAMDSFFNWNFFDTILERKEDFSPYVFEDKALELLKEDEALREQFLFKKGTDKEFAANWYVQLDWIFKRSEHYEPSHMQYPVYRIPLDGM